MFICSIIQNAYVLSIKYLSPIPTIYTASKNEISNTRHEQLLILFPFD